MTTTTTTTTTVWVIKSRDPQGRGFYVGVGGRRVKDPTQARRYESRERAEADVRLWTQVLTSSRLYVIEEIEVEDEDRGDSDGQEHV